MNIKKRKRAEEKAKTKCLYCGKPLTGKQIKFCSKKHWQLHAVKNGYYIKRWDKIREKLNKVCEVCGKKLPKRRRKYCSYKCGRIAHNKLNTLMYEQDKILPYAAPIICEECKGRVLLMSDGEYVCKKCGLVY